MVGWVSGFRFQVMGLTVLSYSLLRRRFLLRQNDKIKGKIKFKGKFKGKHKYKGFLASSERMRVVTNRIVI